MKFFQSLQLLLPALIPSWNFFDIITPSPRIQYSLLNSEKEVGSEWCEFRSHPTSVSFTQMLGRLFWNPRWNESLFLVSCAERIMQNDAQNQQNQILHSESEILKRIERELKQHAPQAVIKSATHLQFRLVFVQRQGSHLQEEITFTSRIQPLSTDRTL